MRSLRSPASRFLALALLAAAPALAQEVTLVLPEGSSEDLRTTLRNASLTLSLGAEGLTAPQDYVAAARADYRRLLTGLYAEGYYGGAISITVDGREADTIQPLDAPDRIGRVVLSVTPGPRFRFGTVALGPTAPGTALPPAFAPGEIARSETVREAVRVAVEAWRQEGNAKAAVAGQEITAVHPEDRLDVAVTIAPGPRLAFGPVTVSGNDDVSTRAIRRIAGLREGRVFDPDDLAAATTRLRRTGAFDAVAAIESEAPLPDGTLPIELQVTESLPRRIGVAAEISSLDGLSAQAFWLHRNLLGGAERFRIEAAVAGIEGELLDTGAGGADYSLGLELTRPATPRADTDLTFALDLTHEDAADYRLDEARFETSFVRYATPELTLNGGLGVVAAREEDLTGTFDYVLATAPIGATWDRRNDPRDPTAGFYLDGDAIAFAGVAGDAGSGLRVLADARAYRSVGRVTVAGRAQLGTLLGADPEEVPASFGFLAGGGGSVRGVGFQTIGREVVDDQGEEATLPGASLANVQLEARVDVVGSIAAAAFYDAAWVGEGPLPEEGDDWGSGVGLGARYGTSVGPIRLDVATPASGDRAFRAVSVYIGIGQAF